MPPAGKSDMERFRERMRSVGAHLRSYEDIEAYDETAPSDGENTLVVLSLGERGELTRHQARRAARAFRQIVDRRPKAIVELLIAGYDDDARELWDIPETRDHFRRWARFVGLDNLAAVRGSPLTREAVAVLAKCGALSDVDPESVPVADGPTKNC